ncbi:unnamed protein product [Owenia fusiformis]|uniref:Protein MEMO1 n=1 Tax=Owenia fusiformis TaxID=6347 RepID=A0A8S4PGZ6_OWEFU|nr:unnamed protein product [Owenia fusiformis]
MSRCRRASHAGSWYSRNGSELNHQLGTWLNNVADIHVHRPARAIIGPHAGYSYCGECGGYAYKQIDPTKTKRIFILGPSHHISFQGCALTSQTQYETPLYNLTIDQQIYSELNSTGEFETINLDVDEDEHSVEMQLPYIAKVMESRQGQFTIVPVLVGSLNPEKEAKYGRIFSQYLADPENFFVISSDFCHWGQRFHYTPYDKSQGEIWQSIEHLDGMAMQAIESMDPTQFSEYLRKYKNTICGRRPIGVLLNAISALRQQNGHNFELKFIKYAQSSHCKTMRDSSVSYASAVLTLK